MALTDEEYAATQALATDIYAANPFEKKARPGEIRKVPDVYVSIAMALAQSGWRKSAAIPPATDTP